MTIRIPELSAILVGKGEIFILGTLARQEAQLITWTDHTSSLPQLGG